jgi:hypothetical protein
MTTKLAEPPWLDRGKARFAEWQAEDGWQIAYTTTRIDGGQYGGRFVVIAHRPRGENARKDGRNAQWWEHAYSRAFSTRKAARARALALFRQHSPRWAARNTTDTQEPTP